MKCTHGVTELVQTSVLIVIPGRSLDMTYLFHFPMLFSGLHLTLRNIYRIKRDIKAGKRFGLHVKSPLLLLDIYQNRNGSIDFS